MKRVENENYINQINNMRMRRKKFKVSLKELGEYLGISRSALSQAEAFKYSISDYTIDKINEYLNNKVEV